MKDRSGLDQMRAELEELRAENRELRARVERLEPTPAPERSTRRGALVMAAGVAGGAIAASVGAAAPARAADGSALVIGSSGNVADAATGLEVNGTTAGYGIGVTDNGLGVVSPVAPAVLGHARDEAFVTGVLGYVSSDGTDCDAVRATNDHSQAEAVLGTHEGIAVAAYAEGASPAVYAGSTNARGIVSASKLAQLQLTPGTQTTHPKAGAAGDLFVDKSARLWFCKVGGASATWKQIA